MRPRSIRQFEWLFIVQATTSILAIMINYGLLRQRAIDAGVSPLGPLVGMLLSLIVDVPLWFFIARRASSASKWIMVVLSVLTIIGLPGELTDAREISLSYQVLFGISVIGWFAALAMLFRRDARIWLRSHGKSPEPDPEVFS